jgi:hypothetical protein
LFMLSRHHHVPSPISFTVCAVIVPMLTDDC